MPIGLGAAMLAGSAIGAGGSLGGSLLSGSASKKESSKQRRLALYMSNTAHQREIEDLRRAGLNPILSGIGGSGASSPSLATATFPDYGRSISSGASSGASMAMLHQQTRAAKVSADMATGMWEWLKERPQFREAVYGALAARQAGLPGVLSAAFGGINSALNSKIGQSLWDRLTKWIELQSIKPENMTDEEWEAWRSKSGLPSEPLVRQKGLFNLHTETKVPYKK